MQKISLRTYSGIALFVVLIIVVIIGVLLYYQREVIVKPVAPAPHAPPPVAYGIRLDSLDIVHGFVANNQNLSALLSPYISDGMIDRIARDAGDVFDVRKIKAGNRFARIFSKDSSRTTLYFIYEINPIDFVVYDFRDSLKVYREKKKVTRLVKTSTGIITSSLWNCFVENKLDVNLGLALSDVYAWTVDFYGLQKGDHFKVIYEEVFVDNKMVGIDRILASQFHSNGKDFYAYHFEQQGKGEYFDENGQSLQRSFLKAPLKFSRISSRFSRARMHPILRIVRPHFGVDYSAPKGTPVVALGSGHVNELGFHGGYGRFISIRHNSVYTTTYAHLSGYAKGLKAGSNVSQGEVIGYVGSSGLATGPHLDFRVYHNGSPVDPLKLESPPAKPVDATDMERFRKLVARMNLDLEK
ncbi:MAG: peptidoglycan DD-metalloendopeptidase family protein [Bacteroidetes bacterium]|nr:peptidoglycan DD-metalloendopeptidase family protein [Bacteroidota bacterium]